MRTYVACAALVITTGCSDDAPEPPKPGDIVSTDVTANGLTFSARTAGPEDGELVILLHGFPETSYEWVHQLPALGEAGFRAVAPDQRGYAVGARPEAVDDYLVTELVADVLGMADALGADTFHVVGHDWGAGVAWGLATLAPDRIATLNILSIPHPAAFNAELSDMESCQYEASAYFDLFTSPSAEDLFLSNDAAVLRDIYEGVSEDAVEEYVRVLSDRAAMTGALNWYRANIEDRAFKVGVETPVTTPTLFIWSDGDTAICREPAEATGDYVDAPYRFEVLEGVNHWIPEVAPTEVTNLLLDHLGG